MTGRCETSANVNEDHLLTFLNVITKNKTQNIDIVSIRKESLQCPNSTAMFSYEIDPGDVAIFDESLKVSIFHFTRSRRARRTSRILMNQVLSLYENVDETF